MCWRNDPRCRENMSHFSMCSYAWYVWKLISGHWNIEQCSDEHSTDRSHICKYITILYYFSYIYFNTPIKTDFPKCRQGADPIAHLEKCDEYLACSAEVLHMLPSDWWLVQTWAQFQTSFLQSFLPVDHNVKAERKISRALCLRLTPSMMERNSTRHSGNIVTTFYTVPWKLHFVTFGLNARVGVTCPVREVSVKCSQIWKRKGKNWQK